MPANPHEYRLFQALLTIRRARYIGAADATLDCDLPLGLRWSVVQAIAPDDDRTLPGSKTGVHTPAHLLTGIPGVQLLQHIVVHRDDVHKRQRAPLPRRLQGIRQGHLPLKLALGAKVHQYLICYSLQTERSPPFLLKKQPPDPPPTPPG